MPSACASISFLHCIIATVGLGKTSEWNFDPLAKDVRDDKVRSLLICYQQGYNLYSLTHAEESQKLRICNDLQRYLLTPFHPKIVVAEV
jgi:hypothetical protein